MSLPKLKKALKEKKIVYGVERTMKNLKLGKTTAIFLAKNCPEDLKKKIKKYSVEIIEMNEPSDELALICKRPHMIAVMSY